MRKGKPKYYKGAKEVEHIQDCDYSVTTYRELTMADVDKIIKEFNAQPLPTEYYDLPNKIEKP